ncbi:MAG: hypothetical protein US42_C0001G0061 [Candidatus Magasanikbacteria bacterium GW2011_GWC2_37_14]|uniref:Uncharacterized protein n=1 Tax=Candidatus Magasanikbacteria bacterium GW2011_GWC2_37_14 TaxID=1619046 RepID=A0A0G0GPW8_9BACT|nr:MAG: hypothetical protein US42_C0001G0061 [Candidatus Magasanikbacteria bacterium GW2011_GWC2_37_14]
MESFEEFLKRKGNKLIKMKDISRKGYYYFQREALTYMQQFNLKEKYYILERLKIVKMEGEITNKNNKIGNVEYRIGYYIIGKIRKAKDRWIWGQFCPMIPSSDFTKLIKKAKKEKTIINT